MRESRRGPNGFPRSARLLCGDQFRRVFSARASVANRLFRLHYVAPSPDAAPVARLGLAVARRAVRRASDRNRLRRQARETFRVRRGRLRPGDYVITAQPAAAHADAAQLRSALEHLWHRFELK